MWFDINNCLCTNTVLSPEDKSIFAFKPADDKFK